MVFSISTSTGAWVIKISPNSQPLQFFEKEAQGLELLRATHSFAIPRVYSVGQQGDVTYLILEKIVTGKEGDNFWMEFADCLAKLHQITTSAFGLDQDNYIGTLPQHNSSNATSLASFYIENRLVPQFERAGKKGFGLGHPHSLFKIIENSFPNEKPSLIHGDLWRGNFLISRTGKPVLIDPAPSFCSGEMDLAMMQLFGGFPAQVYRYYEGLFPIEKDWKKRIELWQLYYLLVHLNLFGESYLPQVQQIIKKYR